MNVRLLGSTIAFALALGFAALAAEAQPSAVALDPGRPVLDVAGAAWQYAVAPTVQTDASAIAASADWKPIHLGRRWERMGHAELNRKPVWVRLRFFVPETLAGERIGFFCTAVDDEAAFYVNGAAAGKARYVWGGVVPCPTNIDLTPHLRLGAQNELLIRVLDTMTTRGGGILGNIVFYHTLPFTRTALGGIAPQGGDGGPLRIVLHLGDALLARGASTSFTPAELRALEIPPSILREDELILLQPAGRIAAGEKMQRVQLENVNPTRDRRPLALACGKIPATFKQYELMDLPLTVAATYDNPFDPRQVEVTALVVTPSRRVERVAAYFWQDFTPLAIGAEQEILLPKQCAPWKLCYRPRELGVHQIEFMVQDATGIKRLPPVKFTVTASGGRGFLRVSKRDPRFFEFDNGDSFFGIGPSGWYRDDNYFFSGNTRWLTTRRSDAFYQRKAANHSNYDYNLAFFYGQLSTRGGFIDQHVAWKMEHRLRTLERLGIYWIVVYDDVKRFYLHDFNMLPYAKAQGGPCNTIQEVYTSPRALQMQKDELRYFISRWCDSPALWIWSCGDEGEPGIPPQLARWWLSELHACFRRLDVYGHANIIGEDALNEGSDGVIIGDWYFHGGKDFDDAVRTTAARLKPFAGFKCPVIIPEGGQAEWNNNYWLGQATWDYPEAIAFHQNLWTSLFCKSAAGGTDWLINILDRQGELYHAAALSKYLEGEHLTMTRWETAEAEADHPELGAFALESRGKTLAWIYHRRYTWYGVGQQKKTIEPVTAGARVRIPVSRDGVWTVEFWDTRRGEVIERKTMPSAERTVTCALPEIGRDIALKLIIQGSKP